MSADPVPMPDARPLHRLIAITRGLLRGSWIATGLGLTITLLLGFLAALTLFDLFFPIEPFTLPWLGWLVTPDPILRLLALVLIVVPASLAFFQGVVRPLFRRLAPTQVARRIEAKLPGIHNRLVSAIDLEHSDAARKTSPVFLRRLLTEALERIREFRPASILDLVSLRRALLGAGIALLFAVVVLGLFGQRLPTTLARLFFPFSDIPPASGVAYAVEPGTVDMLRNEEILFTTRVSAGQPSALRVELYGQAGRPLRYDLRPDRDEPGVWRASIDGASLGDSFKEGFSYRVYGGKTWSPLHRITLVDRPVIARVETAVLLPKYMRLPEPQSTPPQAVAITGPEHGEVEVTVQARGEVAAGDIQLLEPATALIPRHKQQEKTWFTDKVPTAVTPGGTWEWHTVAGRLAHTEPGSVGTYGHWFQGDPVGLAVGKGDVLFAHVYIPEGKSPGELMLEWHDGEGWEHRAYWGQDLIREGKPGTPSRFFAGPLPPAGKWVRLEVPAARAGLEGKLVRGVAFKLQGGQAAWGHTGTVQVEEPTMKVIGAHALKQLDEETWVGRFPLTGSGLFRAELRNRAGHPNRTMKELRYEARPDRPPYYVTLKRDSKETVLSKAASLPLSASAFDDFGLDEVRLLSSATEGGPYTSRVLWKSPERPPLSATFESTLTESASLAIGGKLAYLIEAVDTKGQVLRTQEYLVRVAAEGGAADRQLDAFDKTQDSFRDRLVKLMGDQKKVKADIDRLDREHARLSEKLDKVRDDPQPMPMTVAGTNPDKGKKEKPDPKSKLTPEEQKRLAELQKELAKLAGTEDALAKTAEQLGGELKKSTDEATKLDLLPKAIADQMNATTQAFDRMVSDAMKGLASELKQDADPKSGMPDLKNLKGKSDRLDQDLAGLKNRMDALAKARKGLKDEIDKVLNDLRDKMAREDARMTARDLEDLKKFIDNLREQMKSLRGKQDELAGDTAAGTDPMKTRGKQEDLDKDLEKLLAQAKKLLKSERDRPEFPEAPFRADDKESRVPPREADTDEPLPTRKKEKDARGKDADRGKAKPGEEKKMAEDEEEPKFMPRLGGPREKLDERYRGKQRPVKRTPKEGKNEGEDKEDLSARQNENSRNLDAAEKSLASDAKSLESLMQQLAQAASGKGKQGENDPEGTPQDPQAQALADQLQSLMQSRSLKEALAMAAAAKMAGQGKSQKSQPPQPPQPMPQTSRDVGNPDGKFDSTGKHDAGLAKLDPATRSMLLKMPPSRYREELIRGINEQGPEAYRGFIQDYFRRLTESKKP